MIITDPIEIGEKTNIKKIQRFNFCVALRYAAVSNNSSWHIIIPGFVSPRYLPSPFIVIYNYVKNEDYN
jgi:hypothetical protein